MWFLGEEIHPNFMLWSLRPLSHLFTYTIMHFSLCFVQAIFTLSISWKLIFTFFFSEFLRYMQRTANSFSQMHQRSSCTFLGVELHMFYNRGFWHVWCTQNRTSTYHVWIAINSERHHKCDMFFTCLVNAYVHVTLRYECSFMFFNVFLVHFTCVFISFYRL